MFEHSEEQMNASSSLINKNTMKVTDILLEADSPEDLKRKRDEIKRRREEREAKSKEAEASADADRRAEVRKRREADVIKKQYQKDNPIKSKVRTVFGKPFDPKTAGKDLVSQLEARRSQYKAALKPVAKMAKFAKFIPLIGYLGVSLAELWDLLDDRRAATIYYEKGSITKRQYDYLMEYYWWRGSKVLIPIAAGKLMQGTIGIISVMGGTALRFFGVASAVPGAGWIAAAASVIAMIGVEYLMQTDWFKNSVEKYFFNWLAELFMGVSEQDSADIAQDIRTQLSADTEKAQARFRELMLKAEAAN